MSGAGDKLRSKTQKVYDLKLASGVIVKVRRPSFLGMVRKGVLPTHLFNKAVQMFEGKTDKPEGYSKDTLDMIEAYVREAMVDPKIVEKDPGPDEITFNDLADEDVLQIFNKSQSLSVLGEGDEAKGLENFPGDKGSSAGSSGSKVSQAAK